MKYNIIHITAVKFLLFTPCVPVLLLPFMLWRQSANEMCACVRVRQVVQLEELLAVRHSVFVIGNAGTGKSQVMRSLHRTYQNMKQRPVWADLNPKAVTNDELFGIINPATREWRDGDCCAHVSASSLFHKLLSNV